MKKYAKPILKIILFAFLSIMLLFALIFGPFFIAHICSKIEDSKIRNEIVSYVLENHDSITVDSPHTQQYYVYTSWAMADNGVTYGYFYSPRDEYQFSTRKYRNGYLLYGTPNSGEDWGYYEQICDNWYYYEEHYG